jgi:hypothetical protein
MTVEKGRVLWAPEEALQAIGALPLRLRDDDGAIYAEGMSGSEFEARAGTYRLAVTLPSGVELISKEAVTVEPGGLAEPEFEDLSAALRAFLKPPAPAVAKRLAARDEEAPLAGCRWCGKWLELWSDADEGSEPPDPFTVDEALAFDFEIGSREQVVERTRGCDDVVLVRDGAGRKAFILPGDRDIAAKGPLSMGVSIYRGGRGPQLHYESPLGPEPNAFIRYVNRGMLGEARRISLDLLGANSSPPGEMHGSLLRAVVAGYVFLRANELREVEWLTERLVRYAPEVPDLHVIRMEGLARLGGRDNHEAAVGALRDAIAAGCPWFRSGISYLVERLRLYVGAHSEDSVDFRLGDPGELEGWKRRFLRMVRRLDTTELYTTFNLAPPAASPPPAEAQSR